MWKLLFPPLLLLSCASTQSQLVYKTEYQEVKVPVVYKLDKPSRPKYLPTDSVPSYFIKLQQYTELLETSIEATNNGL